MEGARSPENARRGVMSGLCALLPWGFAGVFALTAAIALSARPVHAQNGIERPVFEDSEQDRAAAFEREPAFDDERPSRGPIRDSEPSPDEPTRRRLQAPPSNRAPNPLNDQRDGGAYPDEPAGKNDEKLDLRFPGADEPIVAIRVEGNVTIPQAAVMQHIRTRPDRPATEKQIREDVRALYATRWFFSVEPKFSRTEQGLVLVFQLLERPIVRRVEYQGRKKISEKHLAAETGLKPGSPFDVSANREAARRVEAYYHEKGFAFATVDLVKGDSRDDREVIFKIHEGPKVRVTSVKFDGNKDFSDALLATKLQTKKAILWLVGGKYDPATIPDDIAAVKQYYHSLGYFDVKIEHKLGFSENKARAHIEYKIDEGTRYKVRNVTMAGNRIFTEPQLREKLKLTEGQFFNSRHLDKDVDFIKGKYGETGRIFAQIDAKPRFLTTPGVADLEYVIDEDKPYRIGTVSVSFNKGDDSHTKESVVLNTIPFRPGDLANQKQLKLGESRLGGSGLFERDPANAPRIKITRRDDPSEPDLYRGQSESLYPPRYTTTSGRITSDDYREVIPQRDDPPAPPRPVRANSPTRAATPPQLSEPAGPYSRVPERTHRAASSSRGGGSLVPLTTSMRSTGKASRGANTDGPEAHPSGVSQIARWESVEPREAFVETEPQFIFRAQNAFDGPIPQPGNPLFQNSPQGDPFNNRSVEPQPDIVDVDIDVTEARTGRLMFGVGVNSDAGVVGSIVLTEQNFDILRPPTSIRDIVDGTAWRGGGQKFRLEAVPGSVVSRYAVSWTDPYFLDTDYSLGLSGFYFNRFFPDWTEERGGGRISVGRQFTPQWSVTGSLRLEHVTISDPDTPTPPILQEVVGSNFLSTVRLGVTHDTRDAAFLPGAGHIVSLSGEQAFGDFNYPRVEFEGSQYFTIFSRPDGGGRHILSLNSQVAWTGEDTPIFERFYAGGFQTFRGFAFRGVGPKEGNVRIGGDWMALGSVEYMFPIMANEMIQLVAFSDFGTVENDVGFQDFRLSVGGGLRITVPAMGPVPLAFDWGIPILREDEDDTRIFSFYVGVTR